MNKNPLDGIEEVNRMTKAKHIERHKELHGKLDELVADMIDHTEMLPSKITVMELMKWSSAQTINPATHDKEEK